MALKVATDKGAANWYWFERLGGSIFGDGDGSRATLCSGCHAAGRDYVRIAPND